MDSIWIKGGAKLKGEIPISGAKNAALLAVAIVSTHRPALREKLRQYRAAQTEAVMKDALP